LVAAPLVLALAGRPRRWPRGRALELVILLVILALVSVAVFAGGFGRVISDHPLEYTIFPFVIWGALRLGDVGTSSVTFVASTIAIGGPPRGLGPFAGAVPPHQSLILLQLFLGVIAATGLLLAAAMSEREIAERRRAADHAVTHALAASRSLTEAAPRILRAVCESLGWPTGVLWLVDQPAGVLRCLEVWLASDWRFSGFEAATRESALPAGVGLPGRVWADGRAAWILDVVQDRNFPRASIAAREGLHA